MHASQQPRRPGVDGVRTLALMVMLGCCAGLARAQAAPVAATPTDPSPPHERMAFFEGTWTAADVPPEDNFVEHCAWLPQGRRHMVCRSRWTGPAGPLEGMSIFSYNAADATYQYYGFRAGGRVVVQRGSEEAGVWRFHEEHGSGAARVRVRITIRSHAEGTFVFVRETALGDGPWQAGEAVRYVRITR